MRPVVWVGSSQEDIRSCPEDVQDDIGFALYIAQIGGKHSSAKPLRGFGGAGVLEIIDQPKVSALLRGWLAGFSIERLIRFLNALDQDIEISVRSNPSPKRRAGVTVAAD